MTFVNQKVERLGLSVQNLDTQVGAQLWQGTAVREGPQVTGSQPALCGLGASLFRALGSSSPIGGVAGRQHCQPGTLRGSRGSFTKGFIYAVIPFHCQISIFELFFQSSSSTTRHQTQSPCVLPVSLRSPTALTRSVRCATSGCRLSPAAVGSPWRADTKLPRGRN